MMSLLILTMLDNVPVFALWVQRRMVDDLFDLLKDTFYSNMRLSCVETFNSLVDKYEISLRVTVRLYRLLGTFPRDWNSGLLAEGCTLLAVRARLTLTGRSGEGSGGLGVVLPSTCLAEV